MNRIIKVPLLSILILFTLAVFLTTWSPNPAFAGGKAEEKVEEVEKIVEEKVIVEYPTVANPRGFKIKWPQQFELDEYEEQLDRKLTFSENPVFAAKVKTGELKPVEQRLPEEPLVVMPYDGIGKYGGTLRGLCIKLESGTSEFVSWRLVNLVRLSDDLHTIVPNAARSWEWNDDFTEITIKLRKGHKWSDGEPFTSADVAFWIDDIVNNKDLYPDPPSKWIIDGKPTQVEIIDEQTFKFKFGGPYLGFLHYLATVGCYIPPYAPKHYHKQFHIKYNSKADELAKEEGFERWVDYFWVRYYTWPESQDATPYGLGAPVLLAHVMSTEPNSQRRTYKANPYYFKVDTAGNQLPYFDGLHEKFLDTQLMPLEITSGNVDQDSQTVALSWYPVLKEGEGKGNYKVQLPPGQVGPYLAFNQIHKDPVLRQVYGDVRFRQAMSLAIDRDEINEVFYLGLATPQQALPIAVPFTTQADKDYMIDYDPEGANKLLDEMGMKRGSDGMRLGPDGKPLTIMWEYNVQAVKTAEFPALVAEYWRAVGVNVVSKEITSQLMREKVWANDLDIASEWDVPYEFSLISDIQYLIPPFSTYYPLIGIPWWDWVKSNGKEGEEPPQWVKKLYELGDEWRRTPPGSARYMEIGREMIRINLENLSIIGTLADVPNPTIISNKLRNVTEWGINNYNMGRTYPFRADQWYFEQ